MSTYNDILDISKQYLDEHSKQVNRFKAWEKTQIIVKETLDKICELLTKENDYFKSNLYTGFYSNNSGVFIKSGNMKVPLLDGANESGFEIRFSLYSNGRILVIVTGHSLEPKGQETLIEIIDDHSTLTPQKIIELVKQGLEIAIKTSYLFKG